MKSRTKYFVSMTIAFILTALIIIPSYAGWQDRIYNAAKKAGRAISGASQKAINYGAQKFKPTFQNKVVPLSKNVNQAIYDKGLEAQKNPSGFVKDAIVNETPLGKARAAKEIYDKAKAGDYAGAKKTMCREALTAPMPPVIGTVIEPVAATVCDSIVGNSPEDTSQFFPDSIRGVGRTNQGKGADCVWIVYGSPAGYNSDGTPRAESYTNMVLISANKESNTGGGQGYWSENLGDEESPIASNQAVLHYPPFRFYIVSYGYYADGTYRDDAINSIVAKFKSKGL